MNRDLTIVTVNYNSRDFLEGCLESVYRETRFDSFQVVIVDNASDDRDFGSLRSRYPNLAFICNSVNLGFSTACNRRGL